MQSHSQGTNWSILANMTFLFTKNISQTFISQQLVVLLEGGHIAQLWPNVPKWRRLRIGKTRDRKQPFEYKQEPRRVRISCESEYQPTFIQRLSIHVFLHSLFICFANIFPIKIDKDLMTLLHFLICLSGICRQISPEIIFDGGIKFPHKSFISFHTDWKKVLNHGYLQQFP